MPTITGSDLKAIVLAAGSSRDGDARPTVVQPLAGRPLVGHLLASAAALVPPADTVVVVGAEREVVQALAGPRYQYIVQQQRLGTADALLQTAPLLAAHAGDLLILYGDRPLLEPGSLRGLVSHHRLKQAELTLLTAIVQHPLPYRRVVRDGGGHLLDLSEEDAATSDGRLELDAGAYVVRASTLYRALSTLSPVGGRLRLADCLRQLIRAGTEVATYTIYDEEQVPGTEAGAELERGATILEKRLLSLERAEEAGTIRFGTGGWRAVIGEGFTLRNVRRLAQALANRIVREGEEHRGVVIGYDRRFLSDRAAEAAAEVFAGNNVRVMLLAEHAPTPLVTYATSAEKAAAGLMFTASHNPAVWNGLKVFHSDGSLLLTKETDALATAANGIVAEEVVRIDVALGLRAGIITRPDFTNRYLDMVEGAIDLHAIRNAGLRVMIDPMYGVGQATLQTLFTEARCRVTTIHGRHDPLFGGRSPTPDFRALGMLMATVKEGRFDVGMATDGDADRIAIVDEQGGYVEVNDLLLLLYYHLHETRGMRGGVVRNVGTTHLLDRLAKHFHETAFETPVGFKHIVQGMREHEALLGGESSGGLTVRGHILGKDGVYAAALVVEMLALTGLRISELLRRVRTLTGDLFTHEENVPATAEMRVIMPRRLGATDLTRIGPYAVLRVAHNDGMKLYLENDNWLLLRFSGTEPLLRLFAEADTKEKAAELIAHGKKLIGI